MSLDSFSVFFGKKEKPQKVEDKIYDEFKVTAEKYYSIKKDRESAVNFLLEQIQPFTSYVIEKKFLSNKEVLKMTEGLRECKKIEDDNNRIEATLKALAPLIDLARKYPKEYEELRSRESNKKQGYIELNRLVSYNKNGDTISLHHSMAKTVGPDRSLYEDAMKKLAMIVSNDPEIKEIEGYSWIVAKAPSLFTKYGFTVEESKDVDGEGRKQALAYISREDFLKRFL